MGKKKIIKYNDLKVSTNKKKRVIFYIYRFNYIIFITLKIICKYNQFIFNLNKIKLISTKKNKKAFKTIKFYLKKRKKLHFLKFPISII